MSENKTASKQQLVYEATLALLRQGQAMHTITVQQIAKAAEIGKGTIYEYFSSREEIFEKLLRYQFEKETSALRQIVVQNLPFEQTLKKFFAQLEKSVQSKTSSYQLVFQNLQNAASKTTSQMQPVLRAEGKQVLEDCLQNLLNYGVLQGALDQTAVEEYGLLAINGAVMAYANASMLMQDKLQNEVLQEKITAMLLKTLGAQSTK